MNKIQENKPILITQDSLKCLKDFVENYSTWSVKRHKTIIAMSIILDWFEGRHYRLSDLSVMKDVIEFEQMLKEDISRF